jgi:hypothetical protein
MYVLCDTWIIYDALEKSLPLFDKRILYKRSKRMVSDRIKVVATRTHFRKRYRYFYNKNKKCKTNEDTS